MEKLIVYADVLIFLNLIIDYFLLLSVSKMMHKSPKTFRVVSGALLGALSSLYIFLPPMNVWLEVILKIAVNVIMCLVTFGFSGLKNFLKSVLLLFVITLGFGGFMYAVWLIFKPQSMVINNSVVYFDISLFYLITFTVIGYVIFGVAYKIFSKNNPLAGECELVVYFGKRSVTLRGIIDTGNSIEDVFSMGEIIICNKKTALSLFDIAETDTTLKSRYRLLPCSTISGSDVLEGVRCDRAIVKYNGKSITLKKPILAFSKTSLQDDSAIINPKILG